jgi:catechol 2,3-dioxygenase-like lactoylglutathione lyase family enzyme
MSTRGLAEIVLIVEDVPKATAFYRDVVGLELEHEADEAWAWFWAGQPGEPQRLALHKGTLLFEGQSPHPEGERWGNVHYAFHVAAEDLEAAVDRVKAAGVDVYGPVHFDWMQADAYYFYDPDGNLLEFWSPRVSDGP